MGKGHLCTPLWRSFTYQKDPWISQGLRRVISSSGPRVPSDLNVQKKHLWSSSIYLLKASKKPIVVGVINNWANQLTELNMILRYCKAPKDGIPTDPNRTKYRILSFFSELHQIPSYEIHYLAEGFCTKLSTKPYLHHSFALAFASWLQPKKIQQFPFIESPFHSWISHWENKPSWSSSKSTWQCITINPLWIPSHPTITPLVMAIHHY